MKGKILKISLISVLLLALAGTFIWKYTHQEVENIARVEAGAKYQMNDLIRSLSADTSLLQKLQGEVIEIEGRVESVSDEEPFTLVLAEEGEMNTITCQMDARNTESVSEIKQGEIIKVKGKLTAFTPDDEFGLGSTTEINYATIIK